MKQEQFAPWGRIHLLGQLNEEHGRLHTERWSCPTALITSLPVSPFLSHGRSLHSDSTLQSVPVVLRSVYVPL